MKIPGWLVRMVGKQVGKKLEDGKVVKDWETSKAKIVAVLAFVLKGVETLSGPVFGHPVTIPPEVYEFLAAAGLWALRDGMPAKTAPEPVQ